jgi:adenylate cyclase
MSATPKNDIFTGPRRFLQELRRRKVYRVAVVYGIGAVAGLELISVLVPSSTLPAWSDELFLGLAVFGFPLAVILAWAFEISPTGVRRTVALQDEHPGGSTNLVLGSVALFLVAFAIWWFATQDNTELSELKTFPTNTITAPLQRPFVAVLPLDNLSPDEENAYFAAGVHEEILAQLSKVAGLGVFARTTMNQYKDSDQSIFEIGQELNASAVLEGSVRRAGNRVRITAQLIDPVSRDHLWSESYDRSLDDVFAVQSDIARRVVRSLEATLSPKEETRILSKPTESLAAYDLYLKGREAYRRIDAESNKEAIRLFERALELDPDYALAWAGLADTYAQRNGRFGYPHGPSAETAEGHALKALEIDPELAEGHKALGYAYQGQGSYDDALAACLEAITHDPNYFEAWSMAAGISYQLGQYDESVRYIRRAAMLAPNEVYPRYLWRWSGLILPTINDFASQGGHLSTRFLTVFAAIHSFKTSWLKWKQR